MVTASSVVLTKVPWTFIWIAVSLSVTKLRASTRTTMLATSSWTTVRVWRSRAYRRKLTAIVSMNLLPVVTSFSLPTVSLSTTMLVPTRILTRLLSMASRANMVDSKSMKLLQDWRPLLVSSRRHTPSTSSALPTMKNSSVSAMRMVRFLTLLSLNWRTSQATHW